VRRQSRSGDGADVCRICSAVNFKTIKAPSPLALPAPPKLCETFLTPLLDKQIRYYQSPLYLPCLRPLAFAATVELGLQVRLSGPQASSI
jgi:hypothetical protein